MSSELDREDASNDDFDGVDIPVVVTPEMAEDIRDDLEETGRVSITVTTGRAPNIVDQIDWQLENEQTALEFVEDYDGE